MNRLFVLAAHDGRLQFRYGIYAAYAFVIAFYVLVLMTGRSFLPPWAVGLIVYTDPAAVGFFFLGALMMLEKAEGVRTALAISPVTSAQYFAAKVLTLSSVAIIACAIILVILRDAPQPALLLFAVALTSIAFMGIGVPIALRYRTVNAYLIGSSGYLIPIIAPAGLALLDPMPLWASIWPPVSQFRLILVASGYGSATLFEIASMLLVAALAAAAAAWWAIASLRRELGK